MGLVGAILGSLGAILGSFGAILEPFGAILGPSWGYLGVIQETKKDAGVRARLYLFVIMSLSLLTTMGVRRCERACAPPLWPQQQNQFNAFEGRTGIFMDVGCSMVSCLMRFMRVPGV